MDWFRIGTSTVVVYSILLVSGFIISLISSQLQCSKIGVLESLKQGSIFAFIPSLVFALASNVDAVRSPFSNTLQSFGIAEESAGVLGIGYLVMLASWITTVWNIHSTEKNVCTADVNEMTAFKTKLMKELGEKQEAEQKNMGSQTGKTD
jgi:hypothetical protein